MPDVTKFLAALTDKTNHGNWSVVLEPDQYRSSRYWMIKFPRGEQCRALFIYELSENEGMWLANGFDENRRPVTVSDLEFWYYAQRDYNDW